MTKIATSMMDVVGLLTRERDAARDRIASLERDIASLRATHDGHNLSDAILRQVAEAAGRAAAEAVVREGKRLRAPVDAVREAERIAKMVPNDKLRVIEIDDPVPAPVQTVASAIIARIKAKRINV